MKQKVAYLIGIVIVVVAVVLGIKYFRSGHSFGGQQSDNAAVTDDGSESQEGEPDEASKAFVEKIKKQTGEKLDAKNVVSTGKAISEQNLAFTVNKWSIQKEYPGYQTPDGIDLSEWPGAITDEEGNITNDFSYVIVDITVNNNKDKDYTGLLWGCITFGMTGDSKGETGEVDYLGENPPRSFAKDYYNETIPKDGSKSMVLIYVLKDELVLDSEKTFFLKINLTGVATINPDYDSRRFIILN